MEISEKLHLEGSNFLRQRIVFSLLSFKTLRISNLHPFDDYPGIKDFETKFFAIIERITNGTKIIIDRTGTAVTFEPGVLIGGTLEFDCGNEINLSYFIEPLVYLAPFCKSPLIARLRGVTNSPTELSVDAIRICWLPILNKFLKNTEDSYIKVEARGFLPDGGGLVSLKIPVSKGLKPVQLEDAGKIKKIRGLAYVCKTTPSIASRMIDSAKKAIRGYIADVFINVDQRKGVSGGLSPGFGIIIFAETTEGIFYHGEAMSNPKDSELDQLIPEDVGELATKRLLDNLYNGGCLDTSVQPLAATLMTLCDKDASKFLFGPPSIYTVNTLRNLKLFFGQIFKIDNWKVLVQQNDFYKKKKNLRVGSDRKVLLSCIGVGYYNRNRAIL